MEKLRKIKLTQLSNTDLNELEMSLLLGGDCQCGCYYAFTGGSSSNDNGTANSAGGGLHSIPPSGGGGGGSGSGNTDGGSYDCNCDSWTHINTNQCCCESVVCNGTEVHGCSCS